MRAAGRALRVGRGRIHGLVVRRVVRSCDQAGRRRWLGSGRRDYIRLRRMGCGYLVPACVGACLDVRVLSGRRLPQCRFHAGAARRSGHGGRTQGIERTVLRVRTPRTIGIIDVSIGLPRAGRARP